ncbi:MAG: Hsp33 family molecular chaperone HslO [Desulfosarcinaceae bacterium]|nr:Hsp33 family molecular chaperone HslO [Desulfosarcinaceae bacterium]
MIKRQPFGGNLKEQLKANARDRVHSFLLAGGQLRGGVLCGTRMVNEMRANHALGILETLVLGHAYLAAGLLTATLKGRDRLAIKIECSGPIKGLRVESNAYGEVRGFLNQVPIPVEKPLDDFNLAPFYGAGFLSVTRYLADAKQPFTGQVMLETGSLANDLSLYFVKSEQIPTAFSLSVQFDGDGEVTGAGGLFLQALPKAEAKTIGAIENLVPELPSLGGAMADGLSAEGFIQHHFAHHRPHFLSDQRVEFFCRCNPDQIRRMLQMLAQEDLRDLRDNGPFPLEIRCHHCNSAYTFSPDDLTTLYALRYGEG